MSSCLKLSGWGPSPIYLSNLKRSPGSAWHKERTKTKHFTQKQMIRPQGTASPLSGRATLSKGVKLGTEILGQTLVWRKECGLIFLEETSVFWNVLSTGSVGREFGVSSPHKGAPCQAPLELQGQGGKPADWKVGLEEEDSWKPTLISARLPCLQGPTVMNFFPGDHWVFSVIAEATVLLNVSHISASKWPAAICFHFHSLPVRSLDSTSCTVGWKGRSCPIPQTSFW